MVKKGPEGYIAKPVYIGDNVTVADGTEIEPGAIVRSGSGR